MSEREAPVAGLTDPKSGKDPAADPAALQNGDLLPPLPTPEIHPSVRRRQRWRRIYWWTLSSLIVLTVVGSVVGPLLYGVDALEQSLGDRLLPMFSTSESGFHLLGTDALGRDMLARIIAGVRISIIVASVSVLIGAVSGSILGLLSGYLGGWVDGLIMRLVDMQMSIPFLVFAMVLSAILGPGLVNTIIALGVTGWVVYARVVRAEALSLRSRDYVDSARALGASTPRVIVRHVFPNTMNNLIVVATLEIGRMIIVESSLSFIGLGVQPPHPSLGSMVARGQDYVFNAWWVATLPGVAIVVVTLIIVLFGDALRDRLDPRRR